MNRNTWFTISSEVEPLLKQLRQIAVNHKLGEDPLSIAVFADSNTWASFMEDKGDYYSTNIDSTGKVSITCEGQTYIKA